MTWEEQLQNAFGINAKLASHPKILEEFFRDLIAPQVKKRFSSTAVILL
jgi:hypothetical protein